MKKLFCFAAALVLALSLAACSQSDNSTKEFLETDTAQTAAGEADPETAEQIDALSRKLIYNADVSAETKEFDQAKASLDALIAELGGYVESSDISGRSYDDSRESRYLNYTVRVPAASLDEFLTRLEEIMYVTSSAKNMEDVTGSYIDTEAKLNALRQEEARLLELLDKAETLDEILQLEDRMSQVRYEIESLTAQINTYDNEIEYSTVSLYLRDVTEFSAKSSFGSRSWDAFTGGWSNFLHAAQDLVIGLIWMLPFLLIAGVIALVVVLCVKHSNRKKRERIANMYRQDPPKEKP